MKELSEILYERIQYARRYNTYGSFIALIIILLIIIAYKYSFFNVSWQIGALICLLSISCGFIFQEKFEKSTIVLCPKCNAEVEKGKLLGSPLPKACKKCGLDVISLTNEI